MSAGQRGWAIWLDMGISTSTSRPITSATGGDDELFSQNGRLLALDDPEIRKLASNYGDPDLWLDELLEFGGPGPEYERRLLGAITAAIYSRGLSRSFLMLPAARITAGSWKWSARMQSTARVKELISGVAAVAVTAASSPFHSPVTVVTRRRKLPSHRFLTTST